MFCGDAAALHGATAELFDVLAELFDQHLVVELAHALAADAEVFATVVLPGGVGLLGDLAGDVFANEFWHFGKGNAVFIQNGAVVEILHDDVGRVTVANGLDDGDALAEVVAVGLGVAGGPADPGLAGLDGVEEGAFEEHEGPCGAVGGVGDRAFQ